jgi:hypothetical protein
LLVLAELFEGTGLAGRREGQEESRRTPILRDLDELAVVDDEENDCRLLSSLSPTLLTNSSSDNIHSLLPNQLLY